MKHAKRTAGILLAVMLLMQLFGVTALAGGEEGPFGSEKPPALIYKLAVTDLGANGYSLDVHLEAAAAGDAAALKKIIASLQPYVQVLVGSLDAGAQGVMGNQVEFTRVSYTAGSVNGKTATVNVVLPCGAIYGVRVADNTGEFAGIRLNDGSYMYSSTSFQPVPEWSGASVGETAESAEGIYREYTAIFEEILGNFGITSLAGLAANPAAATELSYVTMDFSQALASLGQPGLAEYVKTYKNGQYLELYNYVANFDGAISGGEAADTPAFTDVPKGAWYENYVYLASEKSFVNGKGNGKFAPADNMTIAEALVLASRLHAYDMGEDGPVNSTSGAWYQSYVDYMKASGLPWQYANYNEKVTREEFAHIFASVYNISADTYKEVGIIAINTVKDGAIPDVPMSGKYADDIYTLYRLGVLGGSDAARNFKPTTNIQRSEVAAIICRMLDVDRKSFTLD